MKEGVHGRENLIKLFNKFLYLRHNGLVSAEEEIVYFPSSYPTI
jgi:hypothetical protein